MKKEKISRGFTLVELLITIAIIALLAGISLTFLTGARNKSFDANVKTNLVNMRTQVELFASNNDWKYDGVCASEKPKTQFDEAVRNGQAGSCLDASDGWIAIVKLKSANNKYYCIDNTNFSGELVSNSIDLNTLPYPCSSIAP